MSKRKDSQPADDQATIPPACFTPMVFADYVKKLSPTEALVLAIASCQNVEAKRINPHFKSSYFGLGDLLDQVKPAFAAYGLAFIQVANTSDERISIQTKVVHISGHIFEFGELGIKGGGKLQDTGSALTYLRRYALATIAGVATDLDDDGNAASKPQPQAYSIQHKPYQAKAAAPEQLRQDDKRVTWYIDGLGELNPAQAKVAAQILVHKGWLQEGESLMDLPTIHQLELTTSPKMCQAFLKAINERVQANG
jgi:hypothetical protein